MNLIRLAKAKSEAEKAWNDAYEGTYKDAPLMEVDRFWACMAYLQQEVVGFILRLKRPTTHATDEFGRKCWCEQFPGKFHITPIEYVSFAKTYRALKDQLYQPLFEVVEGYGDDSYGDLLDTLPLLGRDFIKLILHGGFGGEGKRDHSSFCQSVASYVKSDWAIGSDWNKPFEWFMHGENYMSMSLQESASKYLFYYMKDAEGDGEAEAEEEHKFV